VQLTTIERLVRYWHTEYDFGRLAARLNALPQFKTEIDGLDIHFIHARSRHEHAMPLLITHGWPGSVIELLEVIGPLTDPTLHGGRAEDAFDVVLPSLPGYGFSDEPTTVGWSPGHVAQAWVELMRRLGYTRYVAQGGDIFLSNLAFGAGVAFAAVWTVSAAAFAAVPYAIELRDAPLTDPDLVRVLPALGRLLLLLQGGGFAGLLVVLATSIAVFRTGVYPRSLAWLGIVAAIVLPFDVLYLNIFPFWTWVFIASIVMLRRRKEPATTLAY
jgi:pimeloyl-ACP methyl ester carboxylesterase